MIAVLSYLKSEYGMNISIFLIYILQQPSSSMQQVYGVALPPIQQDQQQQHGEMMYQQPGQIMFQQPGQMMFQQPTQTMYQQHQPYQRVSILIFLVLYKMCVFEMKFQYIIYFSEVEQQQLCWKRLWLLLFWSNW